MTAVLIHNSTPVLLICEEQERQEVMQLAQALIVGDAEPEIVFVDPSNMIAADIAVASLSRHGLIIPCLPDALETRLRARMKDAVRDGHGYLESSWDRDAPRRNLPAIRRHLAALADSEVDASASPRTETSGTPSRGIEGPRLVVPAVSPVREPEPAVKAGASDATVAAPGAQESGVEQAPATVEGAPSQRDAPARPPSESSPSGAPRRGGGSWVTFVFGAIVGGAVVWIGGLPGPQPSSTAEVTSSGEGAPVPAVSAGRDATTPTTPTTPAMGTSRPRPVAAPPGSVDVVAAAPPAAAGSRGDQEPESAGEPVAAGTDDTREGAQRPAEPVVATAPQATGGETLTSGEVSEPGSPPSGGETTGDLMSGAVPVSATEAGLDIHVPAERTWDDTWNRAMGHCKRLEPEAFGRWRVPTRSEFNRIKNSSVLIPRDMWTASKVGADAKRAYVFRYRRGFFDKVNKTSRARFVCVRDHDGP